MDGKEFSSPINPDIVKKYYAWDNEEDDLLKLKPERVAAANKRKKEKEEKNGLRQKPERTI